MTENAETVTSNHALMLGQKGIDASSSPDIQATLVTVQVQFAESECAPLPSDRKPKWETLCTVYFSQLRNSTNMVDRALFATLELMPNEACSPTAEDVARRMEENRVFAVNWTTK